MVIFQIEELGDFDENKSSILECNSNETIPGLTYAWYKDEQPANATELNATISNNRITFHYANHVYVDGDYLCQINILILGQSIFTSQKQLFVKRKKIIF